MVRVEPLRYKNLMMTFRRSMPLTVAFALGLMASAPAAQAQPAAEFYRGKTITHILAVPNGASWGLYLQTFIEHFRNHVPGQPNIILQSMPGGGGVVSANHLRSEEHTSELQSRLHL